MNILNLEIDYCRKTTLVDIKKKSYDVLFVDRIDVEQFYKQYEIIGKKDNNNIYYKGKIK